MTDVCVCIAVIGKSRDDTGEGVLRNNWSSGWVTLKDPSDFSHQLSEKERNAQCEGERRIGMNEWMNEWIVLWEAIQRPTNPESWTFYYYSNTLVTIDKQISLWEERMNKWWGPKSHSVLSKPDGGREKESQKERFDYKPQELKELCTFLTGHFILV